MRLPVVLFGLLLACSTRPSREVTAAAAHGEIETLQQLSLTGLDGAPFDLSKLAGKAVLVVNVASKCGFTPQYEGLQALYEARAADGLEILGVPCNQFLGQEPGTAEEIATFCKMNYGVTFPLLDKQDVNGPQRSPLYRWLVGSGADVKWNFEKFVVDREGKIVERFGSRTAPDDPALLAALDRALAPKTTP